MPELDAAKEAAARAAAGLVESGMRLGLGTGSTTAIALREIARRIREEGLDVVGVATSAAAEHLARQTGIPLCTLDDVDHLDLALDGADEVDPELNLIKGRGAAHTREKVIARCAKRFVVLVDESKFVEQLGTRAAVPVEVLPMAVRPVERELVRLGATVELRNGSRKDGPVVTDQGFWILDARFDHIEKPSELDVLIKCIPGVLDHGIFVGMATDVFVGEAGGTLRRITATR